MDIKTKCHLVLAELGTATGFVSGRVLELSMGDYAQRDDPKGFIPKD